MRPATARILTLQAAVAWRADLRKKGATLALTNGCFDVVHSGHVAGLAAARAEGDALLVLLNSDDSVTALKGPLRPIHHQDARALVLASLRSVDAVVVFDGQDCAAEIAALKPDVYAKSDEYRGKQHPAEAAALDHCGTEIVWLDRDERYSSSAAIAAMTGPAEAGTPDSKPAAAGNGGADALAALPQANVPAVDRMHGGSAGATAPRLPAASGCVEIPRGGDWGVP